MKLKEIAYARSGDKGSHANIGVIAFDREGFDKMEQALTEDLVEQHFKSLSPKKVTRYTLPNLLAFNFLLEGVLDGGGSRSLRLDSQGKVLGQLILEINL